MNPLRNPIIKTKTLKNIIMFENYFFGYMPLKWRRLSRVLSILFGVPSIFVFFISLYLIIINEQDSEVEIGFIVSVLVLIIIPLISYVAQPFFDKDRNSQ